MEIINYLGETEITLRTQPDGTARKIKADAGVVGTIDERFSDPIDGSTSQRDAQIQFFSIPEALKYKKQRNQGMRLLTLDNSETGAMLAVPISNPNRHVEAFDAWMGARHSRSPDDTMEIMAEFAEKGVDPNKKASITAKQYGHASVADMAQIMVHFNRTPMHVPYALFNWFQACAGQEKSTRFQTDFKTARVTPLQAQLPPTIDSSWKSVVDTWVAEYNTIWQTAMQSFDHHHQIIGTGLYDHFSPENKKEASALVARTLDASRAILPFGLETGFAIKASARDWERVIAMMKGTHNALYESLGQQLQTVLAPPEEVSAHLGICAPAPDLISSKYAEPTGTTEKNLREVALLLKETGIEQHIHETELGKQHDLATDYIDGMFTAGEKMAAQYAMTIWPQLNPITALHYIHDLSVEEKQLLSYAMFDGHTQHDELMPFLSLTTDTTAQLTCSLAEARDWNRHRAWGRFSTIPNPLTGRAWDADTARSVLNAGFILPLYLTDISAMQEIHSNYAGMMRQHYEQVSDLIDFVESEFGNTINYQWVQNLLPLGHKLEMMMHGNPKQASYMTILRERPGGHINYRRQAAELAAGIQQDPLLSALGPLGKYRDDGREIEMPFAGNREDFFDRS